MLFFSEFDRHFIDYFNRPEIDGWEVRKGKLVGYIVSFEMLHCFDCCLLLQIYIPALSELHDFDVIPDPKVVEAGLRACRRVNDFSLCVRFLEAIKIKCGSQKNRDVVYSYIIKEVCHCCVHKFDK